VFAVVGLLGLTSLPGALHHFAEQCPAVFAQTTQCAVDEPTADALAYTDETTPVLDRQRHLKRLGVEGWHKLGLRGKGVKVAVLDSGFCGYRSHLGKALPAEVTTKSFRPDGNLEARDSQHGILCAEVIHAIAPDAELIFANWEANNPQQFLEAVKWVREQGATIISCSLIMPSWSDAEGNGDIHGQLAQLLGNGTRKEDALCFVCAGNTAERHWSGKIDADSQGFHQWQSGVTHNGITPWGSERVSVELCGVQGAECEVVVQDTTTAETVGRAVANDQHSCTAVRYYPKSGHSYSFNVRRIRGDKGTFHVFVLGAAVTHSSAEGSICFPGDGAEVLTIGAVDHEGRRAGYSSCGPNSKQLKPDFVAPVPFVSGWRTRPFAGTSAATPQAAGLAALLWCKNPEWKAEQIRGKMKEAAQDVGPRGHDWETGHGIVRLPVAR